MRKAKCGDARLDPDRLRLVAITDRRALGEGWIGAVEAALEGGATALMLREKDLNAAELYPIARDLRALTRRTGAALIVSDRLDVALAVEADGVHLGWTSLPVSAARAAAGGRLWIGFSAHTLDQAREARDAGADYLTYSPVFPTPSKEGLVEVVGLSGLREAAARASIPVVALGGIDETNAAECLRAGAAGVAAIRSLLGSPDPRAAAARFLAEMGRLEGENPEIRG